MYNGYEFYIAGMKLPIAPPSISIEVGSKNETVDLINEGEINILKSPSLVSISFEARFPMREYPYAPNVNDFDTYYNVLKSLKENKTPFDFIVARATPNGIPTWDTNIKMALESFTIKEDWEEGDDVLIAFELKQYKPYGTKTAKVQLEVIEMPEENSRVEQEVKQQTYTVKSGDTLYDIAKKMYGDGSKWVAIYEANKETIEAAAKAHGKNSSSNGHWIWAGTELVLPDGATATNNTATINKNKSTGTSLTNSVIKAGDTKPSSDDSSGTSGNSTKPTSITTNSSNDVTYRLSVTFAGETTNCRYYVKSETKSYTATTSKTFTINRGERVTLQVSHPNGYICKFVGDSVNGWLESSDHKTFDCTAYGGMSAILTIQKANISDILSNIANTVKDIATADNPEIRVRVQKQVDSTTSDAHLEYTLAIYRGNTVANTKVSDSNVAVYGVYGDEVRVSAIPDVGYRVEYNPIKGNWNVSTRMATCSITTEDVIISLRAVEDG